MTEAELHALMQPISNEARVLYTLILRPGCDKQGHTAPLNYKSIKQRLNDKRELITLGRQINALINELANVGLIGFAETTDGQHSLNGKQLILPMLATNSDRFEQLHIRYQAMQADWIPDKPLFEQLASLVGLIDKGYNDTEKGEFIAYWLTRPGSQFSLFQWTQKFVQHLKKTRITAGYQDKRAVGHQLVSKSAGVSADDNAKKLVEKYRAKSE